MPITDDQPLLRIAGLEKSFFATRAAYDVNFDVHAGEIVALLGENGAGKSTVIKMLAGVYRPERGSIALEGKEIRPGDARDGLISFVHQNLGLIDWMTVAENIAQIIGYPRRLGLISRAKMRRQALDVLQTVGGGIDPDKRVFSLNRTDRNLLAIARALVTRPKLLVLDEPTASLPAADVERLFDVLRELKRTGVGMIYVSHRLDEIYQIADRAVVMRNGTVVGDRPVAELPQRELVRLIVGAEDRTVDFPPAGDAVELAVAQLVVDGAGPVSFTVNRGEVVALCGLRGAGQEAIGRALAGAEPVLSGRATLDGAVLSMRNPAAAIAAGVGFTTSNRETDAVAPGLSARENLFLNPGVWGRRMWRFATSKHERQQARVYFDAFGIRPRDPEIPLDTFSGGNQQKVILARWFGIGRKLLILEEPTMGVDIGAKADIYTLLRDVVAGGTAALVVSTDMEEVSRIAHRALVFGRGRITRELTGSDITITNLVAAASELDAADALGMGAK